MQIVFSSQAFRSIVAEASRKIETETGGTFLGCYIDGVWYVIESIEPGPKSVFQKSYFEYDQEYSEKQINNRARLYDLEMTLIGLWHSHPGSMDTFSLIDDETNSDYSKLSINGAISIIVNRDPKFRMTAYHVSWPLQYRKIRFDVGNDLFPEHLLHRRRKNWEATYQCKL